MRRGGVFLLGAGQVRLLDGLSEIAARQFGGKVQRNMTTAIYTARRAGDAHLAA